MDFLGWYTTGEGPDDVDIKVHKQICEINESPVFLKLNPNSRQSDVSVILIVLHVLTICLLDIRPLLIIFLFCPM